jgi:hypothetical protein
MRTEIRGAEYRDHIEYLRTCMRQLRKISEDEPAHPQYPLTVPYKGHRFRDTGPALVALEPCRADYCAGLTVVGSPPPGRAVGGGRFGMVIAM